MWWVIGGAIYLLLLALGLLFLHGASKLEDPVPPEPASIEARLLGENSEDIPRQLTLPFVPYRKPTLSYTRVGLVTAVIQKISNIFSQLPGS